MFIKSVHWLDQSNFEAEVVVSDNVFEVVCFSHPFHGYVGQVFCQPLTCLSISDAVRSENNQPQLAKGTGYYGYRVTAKLDDRHHVTIGDIIIDLEDKYLPGDLEKNDFIDFLVSRIDCNI